MYTVTVEATFCATHRLRLPDGQIEPVHGHDWGVRATFGRGHLDDLGMVVDFHEAQRVLGEVVAELHHTDLRECSGLGGLAPTAEVMARYVFDRLVGGGLDTIRHVSVTEAPGCVACYDGSA